MASTNPSGCPIKLREWTGLSIREEGSNWGCQMSYVQDTGMLSRWSSASIPLT